MTRALILAVLLAGCAHHAPPPGDDAAAGVRCDANAVQALVGRPAAAVLAEAQRRSGARTVRRYTRGDALTMDLRVDRLNVETDAAGTVTRLHCG